MKFSHFNSTHILALDFSPFNTTRVLALMDQHHDSLIYTLPFLYIFLMTLIVKWVLRGPRDSVIDIIYLPETIRLSGRLAH